MRTSKILTSLILTSCVAPAMASSSELKETNALWNNYNGFGIWIYSEIGTCPEIRYKAKSFVVIDPGQMLSGGETRELKPGDLKLCSLWNSKGPLAKCTGGSLKLLYDASTKEYMGTYTFILSDGRIKKGEFKAQYCAYSGPAKP